MFPLGKVRPTAKGTGNAQFDLSEAGREPSPPWRRYIDRRHCDHRILLLLNIMFRYFSRLMPGDRLDL